MQSKIELLLVLFLFILALFLRIYQLSNIPNGLYQDETALGYNAYSILETGKDEHGIYMPLYFKSFGDQKLPMYVYLTSLSIKVFGLNAFAVRFPSAIFGTITVLLFFILVKHLTRNEKLAILSAFLLAINPWHLHFSRAGFEVNVALFFSILGVVLFLYSVNSKKGIFLLLCSIAAFVLSLYSYNLTRLLSPLILFLLIITNFSSIKKYGLKASIILIIFTILLLTPFIITFFSPSGVFSAKGALITSTDITAKAVEMRSYMLLGSSAFLSKIFFNKWIFIFWQYIENVVNFFSSNFFFTRGTQHGNQGIGNVGMFYIFEFPFMVFGFYKITKNRSLILFLLWFIVTILVASLSKETPHATRSYFLVVPLTFFSSYGIYFAALHISKYKNTVRKMAIGVLFSLFFLYSLVFYFSSYYFRFPVMYAKEWRYDDREVAMYIYSHQDEFDKIVIDKESGLMYTSLLFYLKYNPSEFISTAIRYPDDNEGFSSIKSFGKYEFREINWQDDYASPNTLIITSEERKPFDIPADTHFTLPKRPVVLSVKEKLHQYSISDVSYVSIKTVSK